MPVTSRDMSARIIDPSVLDPIDSSVLSTVETPAFLFGNSFERDTKNDATSRPLSGFLQMNETADKFPILVRREADSAEAQDPTQIPDSDTASNGWPTTYQRGFGSQARASMPSKSTGNSPPHGFPMSATSGQATPTSSATNNRHSMGARISPFTHTKRPSLAGNNFPTGVIGAPKLTQSYSTNDIPTIKNAITTNGALPKPQGPPPTASEQRFLDHNASLGRIPAGQFNQANKGMSREFSAMDVRSQESKNTMSGQSGLHATAAPFGPSMTATSNFNGQPANYANQTTFYQGYGMQQPGVQTLNAAMGNMQIGPQAQSNSRGPTHPGQYNGYGGQGFGGGSRMRDSQARIIAARRTAGGEGSSLLPIFPQKLFLT